MSAFAPPLPEPTLFIQSIISKVMRRYNHLSVEELENIVSQVARLEDNGYTEEDAYATVICFEEVNPDLDEDTALNRMSKIAAKYPKRYK